MQRATKILMRIGQCSYAQAMGSACRVEGSTRTNPAAILTSPLRMIVPKRNPRFRHSHLHIPSIQRGTVMGLSLASSIEITSSIQQKAVLEKTTSQLSPHPCDKSPANCHL